jgi:hypothetical protein
LAWANHPTTAPRVRGEGTVGMIGSFAGAMNPQGITQRVIRPIVGMTNPYINRAIGKVANRAIAGRVAASVGNIAQGVVIDKATMRPTTPGSVALDAALGAAFGPNQFGKVRGMAKGFEYGNNRRTPWTGKEISVLDKVGEFVNKKVVTKGDFKRADEALAPLINRHLPDTTINKLANEYGSNDAGFMRAVVKELQKVAKGKDLPYADDGLVLGIKGKNATQSTKTDIKGVTQSDTRSGRIQQGNPQLSQNQPVTPQGKLDPTHTRLGVQPQQQSTSLRPNQGGNQAPLSGSKKQSLRTILSQEPGGTTKERGFTTTVKTSSKTPKPLADIVEGTYRPKSNKELLRDAKTLIRNNPEAAENLAINPRNDVDIAIGNELINYHAANGNIAKAKQIADSMAESGTELGQAVQAFSTYDKTTPAGALRFAQQTVRKYNKANPNKQVQLSDAKVKDIFDRAHKIQNMPQGKERNIATQKLIDEVNAIIPSTFVDKAMTVWKAGLLTSLRTTERNLLGNTIHGLAETAKDAPASLADMVMSAKTGKRTLTFTTQGSVEGAGKGVVAAKDIATLGFDPQDSISKYDIKKITWGDTKVGKIFKVYTEAVFRSMAAQDKPFWHSAFARSLHDQAGAAAINAGKKGDSAFIKNLVNNPTQDMIVAATKDADISTFKNPNGLSKLAGAVKKELSKSEAGKVAAELFAPFTGVPSSIAGQIVAYSPIGLLRGVYHTGKVSAGQVPQLQRQAAQELGRGVIGTAIFSLGAYLTSLGLMTGQPKDDAERRQWELEGKQQNSILVNGKWRNINSIGPEAMVMLAGSKAQEELGKGDGSFGSFAGSLGKDYLDQTFLAGVQQPLQAISDPQRYGTNYVSNTVGSMVPNIIKDAAKSGDPYMRETSAPGDPIKSSSNAIKHGIPGLRNSLLPRRDVLGDMLPNDQQGAGAFLDLFNSRNPRSGTVTDELQRLNNVGENATPTRLLRNQTILGEKVKLTPEQLNQLKGESGAMVKEALERLISSPSYQALTDEQKSQAITKTVQDVRKMYKTQSGNNILTNTPGGVNKAQAKEVPGYTTYEKPFILATDSGSVRIIDLSKGVAEPEYTGDETIDKKLKSNYKSALTKRINDVVALYEDGQISLDEAKKLIGEMQAVVDRTTRGSGGKKPKKFISDAQLLSAYNKALKAIYAPRKTTRTKTSLDFKPIRLKRTKIKSLRG